MLTIYRGVMSLELCSFEHDKIYWEKIDNDEPGDRVDCPLCLERWSHQRTLRELGKAIMNLEKERDRLLTQ